MPIITVVGSLPENNCFSSSALRQPTPCDRKCPERPSLLLQQAYK